MLKLLSVLVLCLACLGADLLPSETDQRLARDIYKQMVESKSGFTTGSTTPIAEAMAVRLKAEGFPAADIFVGSATPLKPI